MKVIKTKLNILSGTYWLMKSWKKGNGNVVPLFSDGPFFSQKQAETYQVKSPGMNDTSVVLVVRE